MTIRQLQEQVQRVLRDAQSEELLTMQALCLYFQCSEKTISRAVHKHRPPGVLRRGHRLLFPRQSVIYLRRQWDAYRPKYEDLTGC